MYLICIPNQELHAMITMGKRSVYLNFLHKFRNTFEILLHIYKCFFFSHRYCDVYQKCREVDPAGPLATLRRLLLSEEAVESFRNWVSSNWFAVLLILSGVISLMVNNSDIHFLSNFVEI